MKKAIFLDRDWVLNIDKNYVYKVEDLEIIDWVKEALKWLKNMGFLLIVVSNQSWIWRWYFKLNDCLNFNIELEKKLEINFDDIYICPHTKEDNCNCRKPKIWNLLLAQKKFWIDFKSSYLIWDKESDILAWKNAWIKTVLVNSEQYKTEIQPDYKVNNLLNFYNILKNDF